MNKVINGDCLEELKKLEDNSVDLLCTDPPYGYSFMGKDWDKAVPSVEVWKECLRVLKPGAFAFIMSAPRSDVLSRMIVRVEDAGFRVDFSPIYWTYASGFPKAMNIGKMVDKRLGAEREREPSRISKAFRATEGREDYQETRPGGKPITPEAKALDGSYGGFQPKPAVEVILVAMKPLSEKTYVDQALKNRKGITWLDDCRVPTEDPWKAHPANDYSGSNNNRATVGQLDWNKTPHDAGRFPANLLVSDDVLNDGRILKSPKPYNQGTDTEMWGMPTKKGMSTHKGDEGSYSRYFDLDKWAAAHLTEQQMKTFPFAIFPKASKSEKNKGTEHLPVKQTKGGGGMNDPKLGSAYGSIKAAGSNHHPTVKPLKLMSYLITLGSREGDVVLDPFLGSGTTACAAKALGRQYIGIEKDREYAEIARARIFHKHTPEQQRLFDKISIPAE